MAWWRLTDLFALCGPIMTVFLVMQVLSSVATTWFVMGFADVDHHLLVGMLILANLVIDAVILAYYRGRHYKELARPVFLTALVTVLPGPLLMIWIHTKGLF
jgi:nitrogen fixation/metabolism regulation signal transduction histidine kinase